MRYMRKIAIHFFGMPYLLWVTVRWFMRIMVGLPLLMITLSLLARDETQISISTLFFLFLYYVKKLIFPLSVIILSGTVTVLLVHALYRFSMSVIYCYQNDMRLSEFYKQDPEDILKVWFGGIILRYSEDSGDTTKGTRTRCVLRWRKYEREKKRKEEGQ